MKDSLKELWEVIRKYILEGLGVFLGFWAIFNIEYWTKFNQFLLSVYLIILIHHKIKEKKQERVKKKQPISFFNILVKKTDNIKILNIGDNSEIMVESLFNFTEKIRREGKQDMKKVWSMIGRFLTLLRANKFTSAGNIAVTGFYYVLVNDLIAVYDFKLVHQPKAFYIRLLIYTLGLILALIGVNGYGPESINKFFSRINQNELNKVMDSLIGLSVASNVELVKEKLKRAYELLDRVGSYILEKQYTVIKQNLDKIQKEVDRYEAQKLLEAKRKEQELLRLAELELKSFEANNPLNVNTPVEERNILRRHDQ